MITFVYQAGKIHDASGTSSQMILYCFVIFLSLLQHDGIHALVDVVVVVVDVVVVVVVLTILLSKDTMNILINSRSTEGRDVRPKS